MNLKTLLVGIVSVLLLLGLAACNAETESGSDEVDNGTGVEGNGTEVEENDIEANGNEEEIELRFGWWGAQARHEKYNAILDNFEEKHPNIEVMREFGDWGDYWDRLATQTAGGNPIDMVSMHQFEVGNYVQRGALLELSEFIESGVINLDHFPDEVVESGIVGDGIYMVAQGNTILGTTYNTGMFDELGVSYPEMDWTWDDFVDKTLELNDALDSDQQWGAHDASGNLTAFQYFVRQRGNDLFAEDGQLGFERDDMIEWFTMWDELRTAGAIPDATTLQETVAGQENSLLGNNRVAMDISPSNQMKIYNLYTDGELHEVRVPSTEGGQDGEFIEGAYFSIAADSEYPEEAAKLINYWVNEEEAAEIFGMEHGPLGSTVLNEFLEPQLDDVEQRELEFTMHAIGHASPTVARPETGPQVQTAFGDVVQSISFGQSTIEEAVDRFMTEVEGIIN